MNRIVRKSLFAVATLMSAACSPLTLLNVTVPDDTYDLTANIAYGAAPRQMLDVYGVKDGQAAKGVIVFLYGGSWRQGSRAGYQFVGEAFARRGFVTVIPDYRIFPDVRFPAFVEDAALAMRWVKDNIQRFGGPTDRIYLMGHSAGAHIAALVALDERYFQAVGLNGTTLKGVIGLAGPYAFDPARFRSTRPVFEHVADTNTTRPVTYAHKGAPPFLLLHGTDDTTVFPRNSAQLAARLRAVGGQVRHEIYPGLGHVEILIALSKTLEGRAPIHEHIGSFLSDN